MATATRNGTATRGAAQWLDEFERGWAAPSDAESFCDHFDPLISERVRLVQPQLPELVGRHSFRERFARPLFSLLDQVTGAVGQSAIAELADGSGEVLFVELTIRGRVGGRAVELRTVDRITIRDGLAVERVAVLDPVPLLAAVAVAPRAWPAFARVQLGRLRDAVADRGSGR